MIIHNVWEWMGQNDPFDAFKCVVDFCYRVFGNVNMENKYTDSGSMNKTYTLFWVHDSGQTMQVSVEATSKEHALSKACANPIHNIFIFDYLSQFEDDMINTNHFLWNINGRIG